MPTRKSPGLARPDRATPGFLSQHYVYELGQLRWDYERLTHPLTRGDANTHIEGFHLHARALIHFFRPSTTRPDDVIAAHFTSSGIFTGHATRAIPPDIRQRINKQIMHLTYAREGARKLGPAERANLLAMIELDHAAFKQALPPNFARCFANEWHDPARTFSIS